MFNRKWRFNQYNWPPWVRRLRDGLEIIILPLAIFQMIRTIFFPTTFDVLVFVGLGFLYVLFLKRWL
ncbi:hypothetical protein JOD43_002078 [Pullulanibacillus pueri]|uniref:Putative membrane protein YszA n=1 Tax=Pullulanibacillus pueri TaxID=1437324 RepID=A0A8J2ZZX9_9BACL|nr:hypothetical protein [Pullulanibacillus pueri]MBM7681906.1 hypothetical protein [Pullulanibacillus pueri]GGH89086.1 putative membrane protein YszA [Pullulanibacillus pueri]